MRHVLYAEDFEPITILELTPLAVNYLMEQGRVRLAVDTPPQLVSRGGPFPVFMDAYRVVNIHAECIYRHGYEHMLLFTRDEESALLLKATFLPGQRSALKEREREAFAKGFLKAVDMIGRM